MIVVVGCEHEEHVAHEQPVFSVTKPVRQDTTVYEEYVAQIHSIQHIELRALEKGYIQEVYIDEGQSVRKGQILFKILPIIYQAEMQKAKTEVRFAEIEYQNTKSLAEKDIVSNSELALAEAKLQQANAELSLAQAHLGFTTIRAPFDGLIGRFNDVRLGSLVDEGELLSTLSNNTTMWVYFNVPEVDYLTYATKQTTGTKQKVSLKLANNAMFEHTGVVETIVADFNNETGNIAFRATFRNPDGLLRNGETGNVMMPIEVPDAVIIPQKATFEVLDRKFVYVVEDGVAKAREVQVELELPHKYVIQSGLDVQDTIVISGLRKLKDGQHITTKFTDQASVFEALSHLHAE